MGGSANSRPGCHHWRKAHGATPQASHQARRYRPSRRRPRGAHGHRARLGNPRTTTRRKTEPSFGVRHARTSQRSSNATNTPFHTPEIGNGVPMREPSPSTPSPSGDTNASGRRPGALGVRPQEAAASGQDRSFISEDESGTPPTSVRSP